MHILSYRSAKTNIAPSPIHGTGLFAKEHIGKDEIIAIKGGGIYDADTWSTAKQELDASEIQICENFFIAPLNRKQRTGSMIFSNHSCNPNIAIQGQIVFTAMRPIEPGEELTHDWATTDDLDYAIKCRCGSNLCRGTITGKDWKIPELQKKYKGYFCWFLQRKIDALATNKG